jgi:hypothetical protein
MANKKKRRDPLKPDPKLTLKQAEKILRERDLPIVLKEVARLEKIKSEGISLETMNLFLRLKHS